MSIGTTPPNGQTNGSTRLLPHHLADLRKSGLSDETIRKSGVYSVQAPLTVARILKWSDDYRGELGSCLAIPFVGPDGKATGYTRLKPDKPRLMDGKATKYESPRKTSNLPYFPPGTLAVLTDAASPILITEGEKKSLCADQHGFPCIGLVGIYGFQKKRKRDENDKAIGERELIPSLAFVVWQGRTVYIVYDSDAVTNPNVRRAEWALAQVLKKLGAVVHIVRLPPGPPGEDGTPGKQGLDDFLVAHGPEPLRVLIENAPEAVAPKADELGPHEAVDDPTALARLYLEKKCQHPDGRTLRAWRDEVHVWDGQAYRPLPANELQASLQPPIRQRFEEYNIWELQQWEKKRIEKPSLPKPTIRKITKPLLTNVEIALRAETILAGKVEQPTWLDGKGPFPANEVIVCKNGLVHLPSFVDGKKEFLFPLTPRLFTSNAIDYDLDPKSSAPAEWLTFLDKLWPGDPASIACLQEFMGYLLGGDTSQQKILLLIGPPRGGKGTIAKIIGDVVGRDNVAGPTLSSLASDFGLWQLLGKSVAIVSDARLSGRTDTAIITDRLLSISGEDMVTVDRKYLPPIGTRLPTRFVIMTNELPRLGDSSGALPSRMIILRLTESWLGHEDVNLFQRLRGDLPGILLWAIEGWRRLRERGRFIQPESSNELAQQLSELASPVKTFVDEHCTVGPGRQVAKDLLFSRWRDWCAAQGRDHPGDGAGFGRNLIAAFPHIKATRPRNDFGERIQCYDGIGLVG